MVPFVNTKLINNVNKYSHYIKERQTGVFNPNVPIHKIAVEGLGALQEIGIKIRSCDNVQSFDENKYNFSFDKIKTSDVGTRRFSFHNSLELSFDSK